MIAATTEKAADSTRRVDVLTRPEDLFQLEPDWNRLWSQSPRREVFTTFAWAKAYVRTFGCEGSLFVPVMKRDGRVSAILATMVQGDELRFLGSGYSDYCDLVCDPETSVSELQAIFAALGRISGRWNRCVLGNLSEHSRLLELCRRAEGPFDSSLSLRPATLCPAVVAGGERPDVFRRLLRKDNPKRCQKRLEQLGRLEFAHLESRSEVLASLDSFFSQHVLRRAVSADGGGIFSRAAPRDFFRNLVEEFDPAAMLRFAALRLDGNPLAYHFGFEVDGRYIWYVPTFHVDYWDYRPGLVLLRKLFEYAADGQLREFDFTIGDEEYKSRFASHVAQNWEIVLYPRRLGGRVARCKDMLKRRRALRLALQRAKEKLATLARRLRRDGAVVSAGRMVRAVGRFVGSRRRVLLHCAEPTPAGDERSIAPVDEAVNPQRAALSDLAGHWLNESTFTTPSVARERLKAGHSAWMVKCGDAIAHVAWTATRDEVDLSHELGRPHRVRLPDSGCVIYECWSSPQCGSQPALSGLLRFIRLQSGREGLGSWICCAAGDACRERAILDAGYQPRSRIESRRLLGLPWCRCEEVARAAGEGRFP